ALFNHWRRRGITVPLNSQRLGLGDIEHLDLADHLARLCVQADRERFLAVGRRRRHPNLVVPNDRRGPTLPLDWRSPLDVFLLAPMGRQSLGRGVPVASRPAELRPLLRGPARYTKGGGEE